MNSNLQFLYNIDNLSLFSAGIVSSVTALIAWVCIIILLKLVFSYVSGFFLILRDKQIINEKKQVLGDLILMKEIQTELEKEIEQAALKATFQNG